MLLLLAAPLAAQDDPHDEFADALHKAARHANQQQQFEFRYQFRPSEKLQWTVEHVSTNKTTMETHSEVMSSRTQSTTCWTVQSIDSLGQATLVQTIESVKLWQQNGEQKPIHWDSTSGEKPPTDFESISQSVGRPLMTLLVTPRGDTVASSSDVKQYEFGTGSPWIVVPDQPIGIGHVWFEPNEVVTFNEDKSIRRIKTRIRYELQAVEDGIARISFQTEVLTPIDDPHIRSQLLQRITRGSIQFDLEIGAMVRKQVQWNERLQGFRGHNSMLHYLGEYCATLVRPSSEIERLNSASVEAIKPIKIRTRYDAPVFRR
jgi:hypothetical protein